MLFNTIFDMILNIYFYCKVKKIMNIMSVADIIVVDNEIVEFRVFFLKL